MYSVTQRIKQIKQPRGGYINPKQFTVISLDDPTELYAEENINSGLVGLTVDYMTRIIMGATAEDAFRISLFGASIIDETMYAQKLLKKIKGLDDTSITAACQLTGYDVYFRAGVMVSRPVDEIIPDTQTIANIRTMVNRAKNFFKQYGPIVKDGFTFEGGYTNIVSTGDGDFLTKNVLWEFKVSKYGPTSAHTLQLLMYYLMGIHSIHKVFQDIKQIGVFNPRLNNVYLFEISNIPPDTISEVSKDVIGY